jgi:protoporphyrinogen/coproporphyrinogen III oxidase
MKRIAIIGGGIAGITAAYELAKLAREGAPIEATLFESTSRLGGIVETVREGGFVIECGPDGWVTEKPWARQLAEELNLTDELLPSNDATRRTYILRDSTLQPIPDNMSMMVPRDLDALTQSPLFTTAALDSYRSEPSRAAQLKATAPVTDESVASFVLRHFGPEVLHTIAAPLLAGVLGGNIDTLSVRAVMAPYVAMEREHGSLIAALQSKFRSNHASRPTLFTTLRSGLATLIDRLIANIPPPWLRLNTTIDSIHRTADGWTLQPSASSHSRHNHPLTFDAVILSTPVDVTRDLLLPLDQRAALLLPTESSSAVIVAFALPDATRFPVPPGFGFLVPPAPAAPNANHADNNHEQSMLLACTFTDQKFDHRVPPGGRLIRAFFGGRAAERLMSCNNDEIASIARHELARTLGPMPAPQISIVRRLPRSLPQYAVGHLDRIAELESRLTHLPNLHLLGNAYHGVGLPDLIRDARTTAQKITQA